MAVSGTMLAATRSEERNDMAQITIEVPDQVLERFGETVEARSRLALEAIVIEAYRRALFNRWELAALLGMRVMQFDEFLEERQIPNNCTAEEIEAGIKAGR